MAKLLTDFIAQAKRDPYELELPDGAVIVIPQPTLTKWKEACDGDTVTDFLTVLGVSSEDAASVAAVMVDAPLGAETALIGAIGSYFRLGN